MFPAPVEDYVNYVSLQKQTFVQTFFFKVKYALLQLKMGGYTMSNYDTW